MKKNRDYRFKRPRGERIEPKWWAEERGKEAVKIEAGKKLKTKTYQIKLRADIPFFTWRLFLDILVLPLNIVLLIYYLIRRIIKHDS